ncbi:hypothetical protein [Formosa sp. L2A11]|uniref:hypothetical protein n=1 Tax=Formosa sp. L2A11 TaxID=2686363 RepID=UPI00131CB5CE|nr:hypothetical protein [Formosa sp. L2A11]
MKTIPENKIELYLKLGKILALFVKVDVYFESRTFDWLKLEKCKSNYRVTLVRSFDEGDDVFSDVYEFKTLNVLDESENKFSEGDFETIRKWILEHFDVKMDQFYQINDLKIKYLELVKANKLGSNLND